ncbi:hypothetical protein BU24DRAFT_366187, partial [Aaosphaeria arxii CBS 175.79]
MRVRRSIGTSQLRNLTPFLMLDHLDSRLGSAGNAGAPDHPHRGQETISYVLSGGIDHEDFAGNHGTLEAGDLQFMTAGRGIMHSEIPRVDSEDTPNIGLQLWVDLPKALKYCEPRYRNLKAKDIPHAVADDGKVKCKVISGQAFGVESWKELSYTPVWFLHFVLLPKGKFKLPLPKGWNAFLYVLSGEISVEDGDQTRTYNRFTNVVLEKEGDSVGVEAVEGASDEASFIIIAGMPLDQPVVQYGPFVATSKAEVMQAVVDFRTGQNGFERAVNW